MTYFGPKPQYSDLERLFWESLPEVIPIEIRGQVVSSLDELRTKLSSVKDISDLEIIREVKGNGRWYRSGYIIYGYKPDPANQVPIAYSCNHCNKIVIDTPRFEETGSLDEDFFNEDAPLGRETPFKGGKGYEVICTNCHAAMDAHIFEFVD